jgi:hypothetical protein
MSDTAQAPAIGAWVTFEPDTWTYRVEALRASGERVTLGADAEHNTALWLLANWRGGFVIGETVIETQTATGRFWSRIERGEDGALSLVALWPDELAALESAGVAG